MKKDLTGGSVQKTMLLFAAPMILGNLLQQCYNIADTFIVGRFLGAEALAAVGSAYTLMTFLTSILIGLCMGSGSVYSFYFGKRDEEKMKESMLTAFFLIGGVTVLMNLVVFVGLDFILKVLRVPEDLYLLMREYVWVIFLGIFFVFLYNYFSFLLRAVGNSVTPLWFLGISAAVNIVLDLVFVVGFDWGVGGAAAATVISQVISGVGIGIYTWKKEPSLRPNLSMFRKMRENVTEITRFSLAASIQQSVMNFGILMIQGLVNSFGTAVMAAFAAAVKIDSFAYMPVQDFGNAFSTFIAQNQGAGKTERIRQGLRAAVLSSGLFCLVISAVIVCFAGPLMTIFISPEETEIIRIGVQYLHIEGACYVGIGCLFLLYGLYRGLGRAGVSVVLTIISLGTRVALAYLLSPIPAIGLLGIWWAVPIGWFLADAAGFWYFWRMGRRKGV